MTDSHRNYYIFLFYHSLALAPARVEFWELLPLLVSRTLKRRVPTLLFVWILSAGT